jgi:mono/diheme cytochrome c family protein
MRITKWGAVVVIVALAACAQDEGGDQAATEDTGTAETAPAPAAPSAPAELPAGVTQEMAAQGQQIFSATGNCFTCHGPDAKGTALAPDLTDSNWLNADGTYSGIVQVVHTGVATPKQFPAPMPAMGGAALSDEQVNQVAAYVWSLGGGK